MKILFLIWLTAINYIAIAQQNPATLSISLKTTNNDTLIIATLDKSSNDKLYYMPISYNTNWRIMVQNPTNLSWENINPLLIKGKILSKSSYKKLLSSDTMSLFIDIRHLSNEQNIISSDVQFILCKVIYQEKNKKFTRRKKFLQFVESNVIKLPIAGN